MGPPSLEYYQGETGPNELIQFGLMVFGFCVAGYTFLRIDRGENLWIAAYLGLTALCCFFVAGEEISWGQTFLRWDTPEYWAEINQQKETNLHNTSRLLNHLPRRGLEFFVAIGGLIVPLIMTFKPAAIPLRFRPLLPTPQLAVTAGIWALLVIVDKSAKIFFDTKLFYRKSEMQEIYLYYFIVLYLWVLLTRRFLWISSPKRAAGPTV